jgi:hypothetical protein
LRWQSKQKFNHNKKPEATIYEWSLTGQQQTLKAFHRRGTEDKEKNVF